MHPIHRRLLALSFLAAACGGGTEPGDPGIQHTTRGTWEGTTAGGIWVEMVITDEGEGSHSRAASGQGRMAAAGDTLAATVAGLNQAEQVFFNFGITPEPRLGRFVGAFTDATTLAGVMIGPDADDQPRGDLLEVGDTVAIELRRQ